MTVEINDADYKKIKTLTNTKNEKDIQKARLLLCELFCTKGIIDGDCYLPDNSCCEENPNMAEFEF